jgi:chemotaxis protein MotA
MAVIGGMIGVVVCIIIGLVGPGGNPLVLIQPFEYITIGGCGICTLFVANPPWVNKAIIPGIMGTLKGSGVSKDKYKQMLGLMASIFDTMRKEGVLGIEGDLNNPHESARFNKFPLASHDHHLMETFTGALRLFVDGVVNAFDLERLLDTELETHHEEALITPTAVNKLADAFPALGIVAAVLGIIVTMSHLDGPPSEIGAHVAAALVGTMLGIALCYGFVGPLATRMESIVNEQGGLLKCVKAGLVSFAGGAPPQVALEFARKSIPPIYRPSGQELEVIIKEAKGK